MTLRLLPLAVAALALVFASGKVDAQAKKAKRSDSRVVPVLNRDSLKLEAVLLLEPATGGTGAGARWRFGKTTLEATYGLQTGDSLALLCDRRSGMAPAMPSCTSTPSTAPARPTCSTACAVPTLGWPANGTSFCGLKMRSR